MRGAAYRMLGGLDGVRALGAVSDVEGRRGRRSPSRGRTSTGRGWRSGWSWTRAAVPRWRRGAVPGAPRRPAVADAGLVVAYRLVTGSGWTDETPPKVRPIGS